MDLEDIGIVSEERGPILFYEPFFNLSETEYLLFHSNMYRRGNPHNGMIFSLKPMSVV